MKKIVIFMAAVLGMVLGISVSVMAATKEECASVTQEEYAELEQICRQQIKDVLREKGCKNAGISLTYVSNKEGVREYTVCVHHEKLDSLKKEETELLWARIRELIENILRSDATVKKI